MGAFSGDQKPLQL